MNDKKLNQLFAAARKEPPVPPSDGFDLRMLRAVRSESRPAQPDVLSWMELLNAWFPRLAWASVAVIALSIAVDYGLTATGTPGLNEGVSRISAQWLLLTAN
jgi:hypothetical protein